MRTLVFDIGGTSVKYGLMEEGARFVVRREAPTFAERGGEALVRHILSLGAELGDFRAVGVSTAGQVEPYTGSILYATDNIPGYTGVQVRAILEAGFGRPVAVLNDVNAAAMGELIYGGGRDVKNLLCVTYGTGIGGALIVDGALYAGPKGNAGEVGHFVTHAGGLPCTCGGRGCYEAYASTGALVRAVQPVLGPEATGRETVSAYLAGDARVAPAAEAWLDEVALGLCGLAHILAPDCILLGGGVMSHEHLLAALQTRFYRGVMPSYRFIRLRLAQLGNDAGLYGAFWATANSAGAPGGSTKL